MMKMEYEPSEKNIKSLQNIVAENPWFAVARQLLAQEIQKFDCNNFEKYLHKAAIYSINRKLLYTRLYNNSSQETVNEQLQEQNVENQSATEQNPVFDYPVADYFVNQATTNETFDDIIDKFLASPQKISAAGENPTSSKLDETVITEPKMDDEFGTETLAQIYEAQGYFSKAIQIYEKLSLQDSKKSIYFATLIENLKKKVKN